MALADRRYMRDAYHPPRMATTLIIVLLVAFVLQSLLLFYGDIELTSQLALSVDGIKHGKVWQLLTFQFLHDCPMPFHVLFNCLGIYFFGRPVEEVLGSRRFLKLYFLSGTIGGLVQVVTTAVLPRHFDIPVVGASAGVCGMLAIFCSMYPMQEITTWLYFLPIQIRARWLLIFVGCFSLFGTLVPLGAVAHGAHLGGILVGIIYVRYGSTLLNMVPSWMRLPERPFQPRLRSAAPPKKLHWELMPKDRDDSDNFISSEIDPLLDKISTHGIQSLTERERKLLDAARKKLGGR
jgi:membrane associated rhomboid family serine protease